MISWSLYFKRLPLQLLALAVLLLATAGPMVALIVSATAYPEMLQRGAETALIVGGSTLAVFSLVLFGVAWSDKGRVPGDGYRGYIRGMSGVVLFMTAFSFLVGLIST